VGELASVGDLTWREATERALYGPAGFYRRPEGPGGHFRTSVHASPLFAAAVARLAAAAGLRRVVDLGAGRGELLSALAGLDGGLELLGVEVTGRPEDLPLRIGWARQLPPRLPGTLLLANEWLDNVPCDVVERSRGRWRLVLVDPRTGGQRSGPDPTPADLDWLDRWWPAAGMRAEVGRPRDEAWADVVRRLDGGLAVAVDYAHDRQQRAGGAFPAGTLSGYRAGRAVPPVPDGSCDITAHVALDACAAAGRAAGASATVLTDQRSALRVLGVEATRPPLALASSAPRRYLAALATAGEAGELTARGGLGDFGWLVQAVGIPMPPALRA
jgi:SAM-dependent MidA family methyltransferase